MIITARKEKQLKIVVCCNNKRNTATRDGKNRENIQIRINMAQQLNQNA